MHDHIAGGSHTTADGQAVPEGVRIEPGKLRLDTSTRRSVLWLDVSQGAAGDMLLAALIDAGADAGSIAAVLETVAPGKLHLQWRRVERGPFAALKVDVIADEPDPPARHLSDIEAMLNVAGVPELTRDLALRTFRALAQAEAAVHGTGIDFVHFHEVGALDSIGDIVGVCEAFRTLGIAEASCSVVAVGAGTVKTQHGLLSVPPPAVVELAKGWLIEAGGPPTAGELCTPTGMALIRTLCHRVEDLPTMELIDVGVGAGTRVREDRAGVVRALLGELAPQVGPATAGGAGVISDPSAQVHEITANVDDLDPRVWPSVIDRLIDAGAVDAWLQSIVMKKGRPAHSIAALAPESAVNDVVDAVISHTSTIGVRISPALRRRVLTRTWIPITVDGHQVRIKVSGDGSGAIAQATAEFVDIEELATKLACPQRVALARAMTLAWKAGIHPGAPWPDEGGAVD